MLPCLSRIGFNVLVLGMMLGAMGLPVPAMETEVHTFPRELTVSSYGQSGDYRYYGSSNGLWRQTEWHEADNADRIWGQPGQAVAGVAIWGDTVVVAAGKTLALGSVEDSYSWREVPATAITPRTEQPWQDVRLLPWRFVARAERYYTSKEGDTWEALATGDRVVVAVGGAGDWLWCLANQPGRAGHVLGRSEDGRSWTWSEPLPENFRPAAGFFAVLEGNTAVVAGSLGGSQAGAPAILSLVWPDEGAARWQLFVHASDKNGGGIALAQTSGGVWARLPNGDVAASVTGFDWMRFAQNPLGTADTWLLVAGPVAFEVTLATKGGRHITFYDEQVEYAGRGGVVEIAWQEVKRSPSPADDAPLPDLLAQHPETKSALAAPAAPAAILSEGEETARDIELKNAQALPAGAARDQALAEHQAKWAEKLRYRKLATQLALAAKTFDDEATGWMRTAMLDAVAQNYGDLFGQSPVHLHNRLRLANLLAVAENKVSREKKIEILEGVLGDVPTLAYVWALRADLHLEDDEVAEAVGKLAVARRINAKDPLVVRVAAKLQARLAPAPANPVNDLLHAAHERAVQRVKDGDAAFARGSYSTAKTLWEEAEKAGQHEAALRLALLYTEGMGVAKDLPHALSLATKAKAAPQTRNRAGTVEDKVRRLMQANVPPKEAELASAEVFKAVGLIRPTVNPEADFQLGRDYEEGRQGTTPTERLAGAMSAYRRASDSDHVAATLALVRLLIERSQGLADQAESGDEYARNRQMELMEEIKQRVLQAARLGSGEALRIHALWIAQGQMGGEPPANAALALAKLQEAAAAGDLVAVRLLIRAAQAGEWKPPAADTVEKYVEQLAAAGEADAIALLKQRDQQKQFDRQFWGERGAPVADPQAAVAAVPAEAVVLKDAPGSLAAHLQLARPATTTARSFDAARALVTAMLGDERIDAAERAFLTEVVKPSFRVKVVSLADAQGQLREVVFLGSYQPQARAYLERFIPPAGSDQPAMTPLMRRYFWIWTGVNGWKRVVAHAESGPTGRREMIDVIKGWLGEKWPVSSVASGWSPLKDELGAFKNVLAQLTGKDHAVARSLLLESCQELDKALQDAMPDFLYAEFKENPAGDR